MNSAFDSRSTVSWKLRYLVSYALIALALCLVTIPVNSGIPMLRALAHGSLFIGAGLLVIGNIQKYELKAVYIVSFFGLASLAFHIISAQSDWRTSLMAIRELLLVPLVAYLAGLSMSKSRGYNLAFIFMPVGLLNLYTAYKSFTGFARTYVPEVAGWVGGGERMTFHYLDSTSVIFVTGLVLQASPFLIFGLWVIAGAWLSGYANTAWARCLKWIGVTIGIACVVGYFALCVFMGTRGGLVAYAVAIALTWGIALRKSISLIFVGCAFAVAILATIVFTSDKISNQLGLSNYIERFSYREMGDRTISGRSEIWAEHAVDLMNTFWGSGYLTDFDVKGYSSHNAYLSLASEVGVPFGLLTLVVATSFGLSAVRSTFETIEPIEIACAAAIWGILLYCLIESVVATGYVMVPILCMIAGTLKGRSGQRRRARDVSNREASKTGMFRLIRK
ncbi:hypothetical protein Verru16b_02982 [Lacunisphaera limnophila]|uniref:O-antigen ligase-related domain-containing protein n=1 Tax=Lacunisphaera limnophila TaxID=1838286 RepID=A0A1D8AYE3_9BACT|nr:O-antigen ligase family protein [Lacunisphaera limnophila]AOS45891.1 hypothetical protein Verru16b_02982 [Lacunisphaera limnophila]